MVVVEGSQGKVEQSIDKDSRWRLTSSIIIITIRSNSIKSTMRLINEQNWHFHVLQDGVRMIGYIVSISRILKLAQSFALICTRHKINVFKKERNNKNDISNLATSKSPCEKLQKKTVEPKSYSRYLNPPLMWFV